jgi:hypothetical protein
MVESTQYSSEAIGMVPIGAVVAWCKDFTGTPSLPAQFKECDGTQISDSSSPMNGETIPDLNGDARFLRGNASSGSTGGSDTHSHTVTPQTHPYYLTNSGDSRAGDDVQVTTSTVDNKPKFYQVVWVMRIK